MSLLLVLASLLVAPATDDAIKLDLKSGKYKPAFEGGGDLVGYNEGEEKAFFYTNGQVTLTGKVPAAGEYTITINASCQASSASGVYGSTCRHTLRHRGRTAVSSCSSASRSSPCARRASSSTSSGVSSSRIMRVLAPRAARWGGTISAP